MTTADSDIVALLTRWRDEGWSADLIALLIAAWKRRAQSNGSY